MRAGFVVWETGQPRPIDWASVQTVTAFKRDVWVTDVICLLLLCGEPETVLEISEENPSYEALVSAIDANLHGATPHAVWFPQVAFPAFATNPFCLYRREGQPDAVPILPQPSTPRRKKSMWRRLFS